MAGMGPPPKPNAQRRNAKVAMTKLPAAGRTGRTPAWPLIDDIEMAAKLEMAEATVERLTEALESGELGGPSRAAAQRKLEAAELAVAVLTKKIAAMRDLEKKLWKDLWKLPQAVAWEQLSWTRDVAQYVRWKVLAELGDLDAAKEARQLSDRLGLTPLAMLRLRWEIVAEDEGAQRPAPRKRTSAARKGSSAKSSDPRSLLHVV